MSLSEQTVSKMLDLLEEGTKARIESVRAGAEDAWRRLAMLQKEMSNRIEELQREARERELGLGSLDMLALRDWFITSLEDLKTLINDR